MRAWQVPPEAFDGWIPKVADLGVYERHALATLEQNLKDATLADAGVTVTPLVRDGQPADVLCEESCDADMLPIIETSPREPHQETLVAYNKGYLDALEYAISEIRVLE